MIIRKAYTGADGITRIAELTELAKTVALVFSDDWSVDFAMTIQGNWYLIDMAVAQDSWHPEDCENRSISLGQSD